MSKKILKAPLGVFAKKKKKAAVDDGTAPQPVIAALTPDETRQRKLLRGKKPAGLGSSFLGSGTNLSGTLGG